MPNKPQPKRNGRTKPKKTNARRAGPRNKPGPQRKRSSTNLQLSVPGAKFLKCAFAAPDFNVDPGMGIPDEYDGKVLMRKDMLTTVLPTTAGYDTFVLTIPAPGVAYFYVQVATGAFPTAASVWTPVYYSGYFNTSGLSGSASGWSNDNVTAFRYASSCVGIYSNGNLMQTSGALQVWKSNVRLVANNNSVSNALQYEVSGIESTQVVPPENFTTKFLDGCYSVATMNQPDFEFSPIISNLYASPVGGTPPANLDQFGTLNGYIGGIGAMETTIIRCVCPTGSINSAIIKTWNCLEYQVNANSPLYQYASSSPGLDTNALAMYHRIRKQLPIAVVSAQNANFWERVLGIIGRVSKAISFIPGPVGMIGSGISAATTGIQELIG